MNKLCAFGIQEFKVVIFSEGYIKLDMATYKIMAFISCRYSTSSSVLLVHYGPVFVAKFLLVASLLLDWWSAAECLIILAY